MRGVCDFVQNVRGHIFPYQIFFNFVFAFGKFHYFRFHFLINSIFGILFYSMGTLHNYNIIKTEKQTNKNQSFITFKEIATKTQEANYT